MTHIERYEAAIAARLAELQRAAAEGVTRSERASLRVRTERLVHIFGDSACGRIVSELLAALDEREAVQPTGEKVS